MNTKPPPPHIRTRDSDTEILPVFVYPTVTAEMRERSYSMESNNWFQWRMEMLLSDVMRGLPHGGQTA